MNGGTHAARDDEHDFINACLSDTSVRDTLTTHDAWEHAACMHVESMDDALTHERVHNARDARASAQPPTCTGEGVLMGASCKQGINNINKSLTHNVNYT